jgi:hypothetical protein
LDGIGPLLTIIQKFINFIVRACCLSFLIAYLAKRSVPVEPYLSAATEQRVSVDIAEARIAEFSGCRSCP